MMEEPVSQQQPPSAESGGQEELSFMDRAAGVFYEPSRVFNSLKSSGVKSSDWLVPVLLLAIFSSISLYVRFSSPDLRFQMLQVQEQAIDKMVSNGKLTADQAQQRKEAIESGSTGFKWIGIFGAFVGALVLFFIIAGIWLLVGKYGLKADMNYTHAMGIVGISEWIVVVGVIVGTVLSVALSRLDGGLQLGLLTQMNMQSKVYMLLSKVDLFTIWSLAVIAIGLGVLSGKRTAQSAVWVFGIWIIWELISVLGIGSLFS